MKKWLVCLVVGLIVAVSIPQGSQVHAVSNRIVEDFNDSLDSTIWKLLGNATIEDGSLLLTPSASGQTGTLWLDGGMAPPYTVSYRFKFANISDNGGGYYQDGADGIVFMFNKHQNVDVVSGGGMGFEINNGYGIEFDSFVNEWDPNSAPGHIALFQDNPANTPLQYMDAHNLEDGLWHDVLIYVDVDSILLYMDNELMLNYDHGIPFNSEHQGIGISASTGWYFEEHWIDDLVIAKEPTVLSVSTSMIDAEPGQTVPVEVKFSAPVEVTGTPQLLIDDIDGVEETSVTNYVYGSGTNTLQFDYVVQPGEDWSLFEYKSQDALQLNGGSIVSADGAMVPANLTLPQVNSEGSLGHSILSQLSYEYELILRETLLTNEEYPYQVFKTYSNGRRFELASDDYSLYTYSYDVAQIYESDRVLRTTRAGTAELELTDEHGVTTYFTIEVLPFDITRVFQTIEEHIAEHGSIERYMIEEILSRIDSLVLGGW